MKREGLLIAAIAAALRLAWVLAVPTHPVGDFAMYWESADYLREHGALDPEFIYMPGYVILLAGIRALGGGLFAAKLIGVAAGALVAAAAYGIALAVFDKTAARAAGLLAALWPAGIAVSSVTGTDMPATALLAAAVWMLVRDAPERPWRASVLFGLLLGLAATIRAVALPVTALAACYWLALHTPWKKLCAYTAVGCAVAFLVLLPWGIRNRLRYGEFFLTDSHGGHTALVGANPNSDGVYSRSLNLMFWKGTGYKLFAPPHRESDHRAFELAREWAEVDTDFAFGLLVAKADRLLTHERPLLYWPIFRQGVLRGGTADWFARHRAGLDALADGFWYALVAAALLGVVVAASRRQWPALALLPIPLALTAVYVLFFAEVRYHLAVAALLLPFAGAAIRWTVASARDMAAGRLNARGRRRLAREALAGAAAVAILFIAWPRLVSAAADLRDRHRWGISVCTVEGPAHGPAQDPAQGPAQGSIQGSIDVRGRLCAWRPTAPPPGEGVSPVRGVWNGMGVTLRAATAAAATNVDLPPGRYRISVLADTAAPAPQPEARVELRARGQVLASTLLPGGPTNGAASAGGVASAGVRLAGSLEHLGGPLRIEVAAERVAPAPIVAGSTPTPTFWMSDLEIVSDGR